DRHTGLQAMWIGAAEMVKVPMLGADELHLQLRIGMVRAAGVDDEVDVCALFIHVLQPQLGRVVATALGRKAAAHKRLEVALVALARAGLAEIARLEAAPASADVAEPIPVP